LDAGDEWSYKEMNDLVRKMQESNAKVKKPVEGCKELAWWQMIPLSHFLVPLLHTLIGIGNDIYDNFRDIVNEHIECLDRKEIEILVGR
jgi:maltodextrin utilization protein YvdJ